MLLDRRLGHPGADLLDVSRHRNGFDVVQLKLLGLGPVEELLYRARLRHTCAAIADVGGEELDEPPAGALTARKDGRGQGAHPGRISPSGGATSSVKTIGNLSDVQLYQTPPTRSGQAAKSDQAARIGQGDRAWLALDRIFLDANVLFSAAYLENSGLGRLWRLEDAELLSSAYAVEEARRNLALDRPPALARLERLKPSSRRFSSYRRTCSIFTRRGFRRT